MYSQARQDRGMPRVVENSPLLLLTVVSACMDAISYLGLGHVFPANMTGNTVLLGIGLATGDHTGALRSATALVAFLVGASSIGASLPRAGVAARDAHRAGSRNRRDRCAVRMVARRHFATPPRAALVTASSPWQVSPWAGRAGSRTS